jgi:hypothetical protein
MRRRTDTGARAQAQLREGITWCAALLKSRLDFKGPKLKSLLDFKDACTPRWSTPGAGGGGHDSVMPKLAEVQGADNLRQVRTYLNASPFPSQVSGLAGMLGRHQLSTRYLSEFAVPPLHWWSLTHLWSNCSHPAFKPNTGVAPLTLACCDRCAVCCGRYRTSCVSAT